MAVKLSRLSASNPWWKKGGWESKDPDLKKIDNHLERKNIAIPEGRLVVIRGIRRSGKTVYLKYIVGRLIGSGVERKNIVYISCDRFNRTEVKNIVKEILIKRGSGYLLLDEVTSLDRWNYLLKELMEKGDFTIVATGSNPIEMKNMTERLPGRGIEGNEYYFNPLSFRGFVKAIVELEDKIDEDYLRDALKPLKDLDISFSPSDPSIEDLYPYYDEIERLFYVYILTGGFPNAILDFIEDGIVSEETYEMILRMLLGTLSKGKTNEDTARRIMQEVVGTNRTDFSSIAEKIDVHHNTVRDYLELLERSRVVYRLYAWDIEKKKHSLRKKKKIIFQSPLIPVSLPIYLWGGGWSEARDYVEKNIESLVEDVIATHLIWSEERPVMKEQRSFSGFYYDKKECDYVMLKDGEFHGFESHYGKLKKKKYPFKTTYLTKDLMDEESIPTSLFLYGLKKSKYCI